MEFENITSSSVFALNIFVNCPNVTSLTIGEAKTPNGEPYYLKYYGLQGNETFKLTFNSSFKNIPEKFNEGFGKIHTVVLGDSIQRVGFGCIHTYGIDLKEFYPGSSLKELEIFAVENLITIHNNGIEVSPTGTLLIRNIVMAFDAYIKKFSPNQKIFSKTI